MTDTRASDAPPKPIMIGTGMPAGILLDHFGNWLADAFGATAYLVGSAMYGKQTRDVDVRMMLPDDQFDALFPGFTNFRQTDSRWALMCAAISRLGQEMTGLPIDFQFQSVTDANARYSGGPRGPLHLYPHRE